MVSLRAGLLLASAGLLLASACAPQPVALPDLEARSMLDGGHDAEVRHASADPFHGNPPPEPVAGDAEATVKCVDHKREGFGSSGGGCGSTMRYRCGAVRYEVECSGDLSRGAVCECIKGGRTTMKVSQPMERCGNTTNARAACGFPVP